MFRYVLALASLATPAAAQTGDSLILESPSGHVVVHATDWASLPHDTLRVQFHEQPAQLYAGVPLPALLQLVGVRSDSLRGRQLTRRIVIEASDGYRVVLALSDLDPTLGGRRVLAANQVDGQTLPPKEAPYRLLIAGDERPSRWMRQVVAIRVLDEP